MITRLTVYEDSIFSQYVETDLCIDELNHIYQELTCPDEIPTRLVYRSHEVMRDKTAVVSYTYEPRSKSAILVIPKNTDKPADFAYQPVEGVYQHLVEFNRPLINYLQEQLECDANDIDFDYPLQIVFNKRYIIIVKILTK